MRAAWKVDWLRENLMDNVITKEESAPTLAGAFLALWEENGIKGEDTLRRILFWRENVENDGGMNYSYLDICRAEHSGGKGNAKNYMCSYNSNKNC